MAEPQARILIVDDESSVRDSVRQWLEMDGYQVEVAPHAEAALKRLAEVSFDLALLDIKMPGMDGVQLQRRIHEAQPKLAVVMITAFASVDTAVEVLKHGAVDYLSKPVDPDDLSRLIRRVLESRESATLPTACTGEAQGPAAIVGQSAAIAHVAAQVEQAAATDVPVLIIGEQGTGKRQLAAAIHARSARRLFSLVPVACGTLLGEGGVGEIFGQEESAVLPSHYRRRGKLELADQGTLYLSDIGQLPPSMQADLLDVLQEKAFLRPGGTTAVPVDIRLIAGNERALEGAVQGGRFLSVLYYQINVLTLSLPPLRERAADIPLIADHLLQRIRIELRRPGLCLGSGAVEVLQQYAWPGNVAELDNALRRAAMAGAADALQFPELPLRG